MPTYDYRCAGCGDFSVMRPIARRDDPCHCPQCAAEAPRVQIAGAMLASLDPGRRLALAANEKARHEPMSSGEYLARRRHGAGCGCCTTKAGNSGARAAQARPGAPRTFPGRRPWQISH